jgi:Zn-dependent protease
MYIISSGRMIFGAAKPTPVDLRNTTNPRLANLVVSAAGPVSNFFLAAVSLTTLLIIKQTSPGSIEELAYALRKIRFAPGAMAPVVYVLFNFTMVNVALGVFNLIPIPPLDGSGVVISLFGGSVARAYASLARYGFLILIGLLYLGVLNWIFGPIFQVLQMIIFGGL